MEASHKGPNILLAATGSVASVKLPLIVDRLLAMEGLDAHIKVVSTDNATHFFDVEAIRRLGITVHRDVDEWNTWKKIPDPVLHIELRRWADLLVIAPLDANTMAKMTTGMCDNLLTCVVRAWDMKKPLLFCPAMNTYMWEHPITAKSIADLKQLGYKEVPCVAKKLACGDIGLGGMAEVDTIVSSITKSLLCSLPKS